MGVRSRQQTPSLYKPECEALMSYEQRGRRHTWQDPGQNENANPFISKPSLSHSSSRTLTQVGDLQSTGSCSVLCGKSMEGSRIRDLAKLPSWQVLHPGNPAGGLGPGWSQLPQFSGVLSSYLFSGKQGESPGPVPILSCFCPRQ